MTRLRRKQLEHRGKIKKPAPLLGPEDFNTPRDFEEYKASLW